MIITDGHVVTKGMVWRYISLIICNNMKQPSDDLRFSVITYSDNFLANF